MRDGRPPSSSSVASLSTPPSALSTPQWPWSVYSQRHRSAITIRSGCALFDRAGGDAARSPPRPTRPSPRRPSSAGIPNRITAGIPSGARLPGFLDGMGDRQPATPGHRLDRLAAARFPARRTSGRSGPTAEAASREPGPGARRRAEPTHAGLRKRHFSQDIGAPAVGWDLCRTSRSAAATRRGARASSAPTVSSSPAASPGRSASSAWSLVVGRRVSAGIPIIALIVAAICLVMFRSTTSGR